MQATTCSSHFCTFHTLFKLKIEANTYTEKQQSSSLQKHASALGSLLFHRLSQPHTTTPYALLTTIYTLLSTFYSMSLRTTLLLSKNLVQLNNSHALNSTLFSTSNIVIFPTQIYSNHWFCTSVALYSMLSLLLVSTPPECTSV